LGFVAGYRDGSAREESTGRRLDEQRTGENIRKRKTVKDAINRMTMNYTLLKVQFGGRVVGNPASFWNLVGSAHFPEAEYTDCRLCDFTQSLQENSGIVS
jgi:hypothetical protein